MIEFYCEHCGRRVNIKQKSCPFCYTPFTQDITCPICKKTGDISSFIKGCPFCGFKREELKKTKEKFGFFNLGQSKLIWLINIVLLLFLLFLFVKLINLC